MMTLSPGQLAAIRQRSESLIRDTSWQHIDSQAAGLAAMKATRAMHSWAWNEKRKWWHCVECDELFRHTGKRACNPPATGCTRADDSIPVPASVLAAVGEAMERMTGWFERRANCTIPKDSPIAESRAAIESLRPYLPASNPSEK